MGWLDAGLAPMPWEVSALAAVGGDLSRLRFIVAALAAVPLNVAEPLVPPNGDVPPNTTPVEPTVRVRVVPDASVGVEPAALLNRYHSTGPSEVTAEP